jgi:hypothetical protein
MAVRTELAAHEHVVKLEHVLLVRGGIPYEIERSVCIGCALVLGEKLVKRADG